MLIEIWIDVVCPWCYIGERRLAAALEHIGATDDARISFRPFQLDPSAPPEPIPVLDAYAEKFGGVEQAAQMVARVSEVGAAEGIAFNFEVAQRANTFDAHRTIALAADESLDTKMVQRLFKAYFIEGLNINDHETLATLAGDVGLEREAVMAALATDAKSDTVREGMEQAHQIGVHAVPTFLIDGELMASGALETGQLVRLFEDARLNT